MLDRSYFENGHLKRLAFLALEEDMLSSNEKQLLISHINSCDECMNDYLSCLEKIELISTPADFYRGLDERLEEEKKSKVKNEWHRLRMQAVKLVVAACVTIVIFIGSNGFAGLSRGADERLQYEPPVTYEQKKNAEEEQKPEENFFYRCIDSFQQGFFDINNAFKSVIGKGDNRNGK